MTGRRVPLDEPLLSMADVAALLGVPLKTFRRWREHHYGPAGIRLGNAVKYHRAEVETWVAQQHEAAATQTAAGRPTSAGARTAGQRSFTSKSA